MDRIKRLCIYPFSIMIITLIAMTAFLSLLHYTGTEHWLVYLVNQPIEYHLSVIALLVVIKAGKAVYAFYPTILGIYRQVNRAVNRVDELSARLNKIDQANSPFKNGGSKRQFSTTASLRYPQGNQLEPLSADPSSGKTLNLLTLLRNKYEVVDKMIPLSDRIGTLLHKPLAFNNMLANGRVGRLAGGIWRTQKFISFVLKCWHNHGTTFTIKWLKGCHVAIARALGNNKLLSLRQLTEDLPLPRLCNGLPSVIPFEDRMRIRRGNVPTIRFWLGLFNLYRILKAPSELKLGTITNPWTGEARGMRVLLRTAKRFNPFLFCKGTQLRGLTQLGPTGIVLSRSASPSNRVSMYGILTDVALLVEHAPNLWSAIKSYLKLTGAEEFLFMLEHALDLRKRLDQWDGTPGNSSTEYHLSKSGRPLYTPDSTMLKPGIRQHGLPAGDGLSQFALKEEAAGKLRVFALVDNVTQSTLRPLHDYLFSVLKALPTDGTFNQEASVERLMFKAVKAGKAFSFDLTAATDRIPVALTQRILANMLGSDELARLWRQIMVSRPFGFNPDVASKLGLDPEKEYRYAVGQPMGALSSWAGLAITHHWIVQHAAYLVYHKSEWFDDYEVLGDDIVICDELVAQKYLDIMRELGCEINLTKSIVSRDRPVFEFAKRICWGFAIVSGISLAQVRAGWRVGGRVANVLQFASSGLLENSSSLLLACLSRNAFQKGKALPSLKTDSPQSQKSFSLGVLSLLGERFQKGIVSLRELMHAIIEPKGPIDLNRDAIAIPIRAASKLAYSALVEPNVKRQYPFSHEWDREPKFLEMEDKVATEMLHTGLNKAKALWDNFDQLLERGAQQLYYPLMYYTPAETWSSVFLGKVSMKAVDAYIKKRLPKSQTRVMSDDKGNFTIEHRLAPEFEPVPYADLPPKYLALITEVEQFYSWMLGLEMTNKHPSELYNKLYMEMDSMLLYDEALELYEEVESFEQLLEIVDKDSNKPGTTIVETAPILASLRGILGPRKVRRWLEGFTPTESSVLIGPV